MNIYATLPDLRRALGLSAAQTGDDDRLLMALGAASRLIEGYAGRVFYPVRAARTYSVIDPALLLLDSDLLALHSLTNGDGASIALDAVHTLPSGQAVVSALLLDRTQVVFTHSGDPVDAITVDGTWGCHPGWAEAWRASGDTVQDAPLSDSATTLHVGDVDAPELTGYGQRFAVGQLVRIEDEMLAVLAVDTTTNALTVTRGANGTTITQHAQGTAIAIYAPPEDVRQVCLRVAAWLYRQPDAGFVQAAGGLRGQIAVPPALPDDVAQVLAPYVRVRVA